LTFNLPKSGNVNLTINDLSGKIISQYNNHLQDGVNCFQLPNLECGLYIVSVSGNGYRGVKKLMSIGQKLNSTGIIQKIGDTSIQKIESNTVTREKIKSSATIKKGMIYTNGDRLKITGTAGLCKTILIDSISRDRNIDIYFINCVDADGNAYPVTKIGSLYWMTENLRTTKNNDKKALNLINTQTGQPGWSGLQNYSEAFCFYNDNPNNGTLLGALYTYNAATSGITPTGWRLPSQAEYNEMVVYLGGNSVAGGKLKTSGTNSWTTPNNGATNETGFNALASGFRTTTGFSEPGSSAAFWTSDKVDAGSCYSTLLEYNKASVNISKANVKQNGLSIRCVFQTPDTRIVMLKSIFGKDAEPKAPLVGLDTLPIQKTTYLMPADKELIFMLPTADAPAIQLNYNATNASISSIPYTPIAGVKWWYNFKKIATQLNENGHENTIIAVWNESSLGVNCGTAKVTLHILGDSLSR
jgi:uncharacterized protein (TIGR02145 family)